MRSRLQMLAHATIWASGARRDTELVTAEIRRSPSKPAWACRPKYRPDASVVPVIPFNTAVSLLAPCWTASPSMVAVTTCDNVAGVSAERDGGLQRDGPDGDVSGNVRSPLRTGRR